jgi:hypothetical protein
MPHQTTAESCPAPLVRSNHRERIPTDVCLATAPLPIRSAVARKAWAFCQDEAWMAVCCRIARPPSNDGRKRRSNRQSQPLPSTTRPSRIAWPRSFDGLRGPRRFRMVSCPNSSAANVTFH